MESKQPSTIGAIVHTVRSRFPDEVELLHILNRIWADYRHHRSHYQFEHQYETLHGRFQERFIIYKANVQNFTNELYSGVDAPLFDVRELDHLIAEYGAPYEPILVIDISDTLAGYLISYHVN